MKRLLMLSLLMLVGACSTAKQCGVVTADSTGDPFDACDPIKPVNQGIFEFNLVADTYVVGPVAHAYHEVPETGRGMVDNFLTNLGEPANVLNSTLQGDIQAAGTSLWRFILNTTFGFAGLRDFAGENGLKYNEQNFGKTLASYGVGEGPYLVLPVVGPSSVRGTVGKVVDWFTDPVGMVLTRPQSIAQEVADGINTRDQEDALIDQFYYQSLDPYAATRAAYLQHQAFR